MASALMRRSAMTALLAAVATVASPLAGTGWAAAAALGAPTASGPSGTDKETRPTATFTYGQAMDPTTSTISIVDTSAGNAAVPCARTFGTGNLTINCTVTADLVDNHIYKATANVFNADDTDHRTGDTTTWTTDIPSKVKQTPGNGSISATVNSFSVTFDEPISTDPTKITVDLVNSAGHHVQNSGHTSGSDAFNATAGAEQGTATWTSDVGGLAPSTYTANFRVFASPTPFNPANTTPANASDWGTATITFTVDNSLPADAPHDVQAPTPNAPGDPQITQANLKGVPFTGMAPVGSNVAVVIYDETFDSHDVPFSDTEGSGQNDSTGSTVTQNCPDSQAQTTINDVRLCPFTVLVDATNSPDSGSSQVATDGTPYSEKLQWYAFTYTSAGQKPGHACPGTSTDCPSADPTIVKDATGPDTPGGGDARWNPNTNTVTVEKATDTNTDGSLDHYLVTVTDPEGHVVSVPTGHVGVFQNYMMNALDVDVSTLNDGPLTVKVFAVDQWGNLSGADTLSTPAPSSPNDHPTLIKESTRTMPSVDTTRDVLIAGGTTYNFTCASSSQGCHALTPTTRVNTPTSVTVYFNEPIKLSRTDTSGTNNSTMRSQICLDDSTGPGSCLNNGAGTTTVTSDSMGLTWTAPAGFSLPSDSYSVSAFAISKDNCPDKTDANASNYPGCDTTPQPANDPVADSGFIVDQTPPTVQFTSVPAVDGSNAKATTISGTTDGDTTQVVLSIKSSGGGATRIVPISTTPTSDGTGRITWSTTQDLSALPDGTLTLSATGTDGAGNTTAQADAATATTSMAARPSAPLNLSAAAGNGQAVLTWVAPSYTGNVPLSGYSLTVTDTSVPGSAPATLSVDPAATSYTVSGLANGHAYSFALTAANNIGSGPAATTSGTPKGNTAVSVIASRGTITYSQFLAIHGTLSYLGVGLANEPVTITTIYFNGHHGATYNVTTDQNGNWVVAGLSPGWNVTYVATFGGDSAYNASSGAAGVRVRVLIRILHAAARNRSHLTPVTLRGNVRPNWRYQRVYVYELRAHGRLHYLGYAKLTRKSTWFFTRKFARGRHTLVARFLNHRGNYGNWSNRIRFSRS